jgi:hypothetical protein
MCHYHDVWFMLYAIMCCYPGNLTCSAHVGVAVWLMCHFSNVYLAHGGSWEGHVLVSLCVSLALGDDILMCHVILTTCLM